MVRQTLDEAHTTARRLPAALARPVRAVVVCGTWPRGRLREALRALRRDRQPRPGIVRGGERARWARRSHCSGLLFGRDVVEALGPTPPRAAPRGPPTSSSCRAACSTSPACARWTSGPSPRFQDTLGCPVVAAEWTPPPCSTRSSAPPPARIATPGPEEVIWISPLGYGPLEPVVQPRDQAAGEVRARASRACVTAMGYSTRLELERLLRRCRRWRKGACGLPSRGWPTLPGLMIRRVLAQAHLLVRLRLDQLDRPVLRRLAEDHRHVRMPDQAVGRVEEGEALARLPATPAGTPRWGRAGWRGPR